MTKLYSFLLVLLVSSGCANVDPLTAEDLGFLIRSGNATSSFDENNMHVYSSHIERARKLEKIGLITVKVGYLDIENETGLYTSQNVTALGKVVINKIANNTVNSTDLPLDLLKQIQGMESNIFRKYKLNLSQYIFLTNYPSGDIAAPGEEVFTLEKETIEIVKYLSNKGYLEYIVYDDTFNGKPAKYFRWWPTQKGIEFNAGLRRKAS